MPHIEGIEVPIYEPRKRRKGKRTEAERKATWLKWYHNTRNLALATLGGKCSCGCGETDPDKLYIIALTNEAKAWSQNLFYKRLIDCFREGGDPAKLGSLIRKEHKFEEMKEEGKKRRLIAKGTGEFYWVAGKRVEQMRAKTGVNAEGNMIWHGQLEELGSKKLEESEFTDSREEYWN